VRSQAADEPLDKDLEDGGADERVKETDNSVVDVPERSNADLHHKNDEDGDDAGEKGGEPDGDDLIAKRVSKFGKDNLAVGKGDRE
jgi:hypothetical protein